MDFTLLTSSTFQLLDSIRYCHCPAYYLSNVPIWPRACIPECATSSVCHRLAKTLYPNVRNETFFESCGLGDLITTCLGGRNHATSEAWTRAWKVRLMLGSFLGFYVLSGAIRAEASGNCIVHYAWCLSACMHTNAHCTWIVQLPVTGCATCAVQKPGFASAEALCAHY